MSNYSGNFVEAPVVAPVVDEVPVAVKRERPMSEREEELLNRIDGHIFRMRGDRA